MDASITIPTHDYAYGGPTSFNITVLIAGDNVEERDRHEIFICHKKKPP